MDLQELFDLAATMIEENGVELGATVYECPEPLLPIDDMCLWVDSREPLEVEWFLSEL
jgi:hypothetical protein